MILFPQFIYKSFFREVKDMVYYDRMKEITEAIQASDYALRCLNNASKSLDSARNWGIYDMFGGGTISTLIKHSKMSDSKYYMEQARFALMSLKKELMDVNVLTDLKLETGGFLEFADFFCDGFLVDWVVQGRINDARWKIRNTIYEVENIRRQLQREIV
jgi:hypothetical protein